MVLDVTCTYSHNLRRLIKPTLRTSLSGTISDKQNFIFSAGSELTTCLIIIHYLVLKQLLKRYNVAFKILQTN